MTLEQALWEAHAKADNDALVELYTIAANQFDCTDAACFYLTQAYILALEQNHPNQDVLYQRLRTLERI